MSDPTAKRAAEVERRVDVVRRVAADAGARGVLLASRHNFAWLTVGGLNHVLLATERGAVPLLVSADRSVALAPINEAARIADEELAGLPLEILETPWAEAADPHPVAERLAGGPVVDDDAVEQALLPRRSQLVPLEHERLAELGRTAAAATDEVVGSTSADDSEHEVGAELTHRLLRQGIRAPVVLVAADERIARYRHPLPTGRRVGHRVMVVLVAECDGLHVALTRIAELEPPSADLALRIRGAEDVLRAMRDATRPGATLGSVLAAGQRAYATAGFGEEWRYHHQGGSIGYRARERIAVPGDPTPIVPGMAFAWNPSIAGAKAEETILLDPAGEARILT
ncbi:MAG TPA: M24 family metallopeptidase [Candidatus Limnocylindria bacterium]|nr:M24 family metallopeptidase [Candidatus Limnocylindria bacterium]